MCHSNRVLIIIFCALLAASHGLRAAPSVGDKFGDWVFECQALAANNTVCALTQTFLKKDTNQRVLSIVLKTQGPKNDLLLLTMIPLGVYIPTGVTGAIDGGKTFPITLQTCNNQGCIASTLINADLKKALSAGKVLSVIFAESADAKPLAVDVSLSEIANGLTAINAK